MKRILIIDDDFCTRQMLREIMEMNGHETVDAGNGKEAVKRVRDTSFHLAIVDIFMPEKDGLEVIREFRRGYPDLKIIAISGGGQYNNQQFLDVALRFGAHRTLSKPFVIKEMRTVVQELLCA